MKREIMIGAAAALTALAGQATGQVQHGTIIVVENDGGNDSTSVSLSRSAMAPMGGGWTIDGANSNRGDYPVDFGNGVNDTNLGILITSVFEDERFEPSINDGLDPYFCTSHAARGSSGYFIPIQQTPTGSEANCNVALGYFPLADGWLAGAAYNSENGGIITELVANPSIELTNLFAPTPAGSYFLDQGTGVFILSLEGLDLRRDGVLLATGAKNEDNYAQVFCTPDGNAILNVHDNGDDGGGQEQDPVAFVFIPDGTTGVTMGRVSGNGTLLYNQGNPSVELVDQPTTNGTFRVTIPGESPSTGTFLAQAVTRLAGGTVDNPVFARPDGDGWIVTTRDVTGMDLQDLNQEIAFHFAFFPYDETIVPGTPAQAYVDRLDDVVAGRVVVTEFSPDNGLGDMKAEFTGASSDALKITGDNRGDVGWSWLDAIPAARIDNNLDITDGLPDGAPDGLAFGLCSELVRFNDVTGGISGVGTLGIDNGEVRTHVADSLGGEMNIDFGLAFFPTAAGFQMEADKQDVPDGQLTIDVGIDALANGFLFGQNWDNNNRFATVSTSGNAYTIQGWNGETGAALASGDNFDVGYVYLPFSAENLVAGHVDASGNVLSGTTAEGAGQNFTVSLGTDSLLGSPIFEITIDGVDARNDGGVILANAADGPRVCAWEVGENGEFEVGIYNVATLSPEQAAFSFAYIPAEGLALPAGPEGCNDADIAEPFGILDLADISAFVAAFIANDPVADLDSNGIFDLADISGFVGAFSAGCP